jgi:hypothetical protein
MPGTSMMIETELDFFRRREQEERLAAESAVDSCAREAHRVLAERYAEQVCALLRQARFSTLVPVRRRVVAMAMRTVS